MPERGIRSTYSQAPFRIKMCDLGGVISTGTAFHYEANGLRFLVTNWHNVTGRDFFSGELLDREFARTPLWLEVETATYVNDRGQYAIIPHRLDLYQDADAPFERRWLEHPTIGCDVVAVPLAKPRNQPEFMHYPTNRIGRMRVPVRPGVLAFVIGFPQGLSVGFGLPIWKSTFIASEPHYDVNVNQKLVRAFFLDGHTRKGMSGAPVFAQFTGTWDATAPYTDLDFDKPNFWSRDDVVMGDTALEFIGIYSGRLTSGKEHDAALGLCWKTEVIEEICLGSPRLAMNSPA